MPREGARKRVIQEMPARGIVTENGAVLNEDHCALITWNAVAGVQ